MSSFFDSEIIQNELKEINELQKEIYQNVLAFSSMSREDKLNHIEKLSDLLEKQKIMYTRLSLSDDPKAIKMKENLIASLALIGFSPETDMITLFNSIDKTIQKLRQNIDT